MTEQTTVRSQTALSEDNEISLIDLAIALGEEKATILKVTGLFTAVAVVVALVLPNIYTAKTVMMPPQQQQSGAASALASLGGLAGLAGAAAGVKSPDEMYVAFLQSEGLQKSIIEKLKLQERYDAKTIVDTRKKLQENVRISPDKKSGLITIEADDKDPEFSAQLANLHVDALRVLLGRLAVTDAQQRRMFYEQQIKKVQVELAEAEQSFKQAKAQSGMQVTAVLAESGVRASAELRGQIAAREVQMSAMSRFATTQNPDVQRLGSELSALRGQLNKLEQGSGFVEASTPMQQQAVKSYRDVKVQESILEVLIKQYELARVDEAKEGPLLQQLDVATSPERKAKPKRALIVLGAVFGGFFFSVLFVFIRRSVLKAHAGNAQQFAHLRRVWIE
jgi:tyrosine-protein kinase Etk/Wzc